MLLNTKKTANYQFVSVQINGLQNRYYFPDLPNLRNVRTHKIVAYNTRNFTVDINNVANVTTGIFQSSYVTLYANGFEFIQKMDLISLSTLQGYNVYSNQNGSIALAPVEIDFSKCYIELTKTTPLSYPFSFTFGVYYNK